MVQFDWNEANIAHIRRHAIEPQEAEQVVSNQPLGLEEQFRSGETRLSQLGVTNAGRILIVVTTIRQGRQRVVTAFDANRNMRKYFLEAKARRYAEHD